MCSVECSTVQYFLYCDCGTNRNMAIVTCPLITWVRFSEESPRGIGCHRSSSLREMLATVLSGILHDITAYCSWYVDSCAALHLSCILWANTTCTCVRYPFGYHSAVMRCDPIPMLRFSTKSHKYRKYHNSTVPYTACAVL